MQFKSQLMDSEAVVRALRRISFEIIEKNKGADDLCFIGIKRRGICIAKELCNNIKLNENAVLPVGELDVTRFRDDVDNKEAFPSVTASGIDFDINNKTVILTDDVLFTGRTVRAAIEAIFSLGRPKAIRLAVLIDRGHRELPIKPDFIGKNIPTSINEIVKVTFPEIDNQPISVSIYAK